MSTSQTEQNRIIDYDKRNIVITGFGLFRDHQVNPSWEAIKDGQLNIDRPNLNIITKQVNVSYEAVDKVVSVLWKNHNPLLMVHVGLAAHETAIRIEQVARHGPYIHDDVFKYAPHENLRQYGDRTESLEENIILRNYTCKPCSFADSRTCINVDKICDKMNQAYEDRKLALPTKKSQDAGLYVCEYIYQKSLLICDRAIFIHVPDTEKFKLEDIRNALKYAIEAIIDEVLTNTI